MPPAYVLTGSGIVAVQQIHQIRPFDRETGAVNVFVFGETLLLKVFIACLAVAAFAAAACSGAEEPPCPSGTEQWVEYRLFMGRGGEAGEVVTDADWEAFLAGTVTPRFPDGLTVLDARGQWRDQGGALQTERSKLLVILAPPGDDGERRIDEISKEYISRFQQESVLQVVDEACVSFS